MPPAPVYKHLGDQPPDCVIECYNASGFHWRAGQSVLLAANSALMSASCLQPAPPRQPAATAGLAINSVLLNSIITTTATPPPTLAAHMAAGRGSYHCASDKMWDTMFTMNRAY